MKLLQKNTSAFISGVFKHYKFAILVSQYIGGGNLI
jgi:hypothetical protein